MSSIFSDGLKLDSVPESTGTEQISTRVLESRLCALRCEINAQIEKDLTLCEYFLSLRKKVYSSTNLRTSTAQYEFNNIFSRFYITERNAMCFASTSCEDRRLVASEAYMKMQQELVEKGFGEVPLLSGTSNQADKECAETCLPETSQRLQVLQVSRDSAASVFEIENVDIRMRVADEVRDRLTSQALSFLRQRCGSKGNLGQSSEVLAENIFMITVFNYFLASSSLYWGLGPTAYAACKASGAILECYASPFNNSLPVFCSPCEPIDLIFGSLGSIHGALVENYLRSVANAEVKIVANPPYIEYEILCCVQRIAKFLEDREMTVLSILPAWRDAEGYMILQDWVRAGRGVAVELPRGQYSYFDYEEGRDILSNFDSTGFIISSTVREDYQNDAAMYSLLKVKAPSLQKRARMH